MIKVENATFAYKVGGFRIDIPRLDIAAGEKVAVIGPSGLGKTTLLHLLSGVLVPSAGRVVVDGIEVSGLSREDRQDYRALRLGMVFQEFELLEYLDVIDNVLLPYRISPVLYAECSGTRACEIAGPGGGTRRQAAAVSRPLVAG